MKYRLLSKTEQDLYQVNICATIDYTDLAGLANGNTGSFKFAPYGGGDGVVQPYADLAVVPTIPAGTILTVKATILDAPFVFGDAAILSNAFIIGDSGSANRYVASQETASGGAFVTYSEGTGTKFMLVAADNLIAAFTGTAAHNLNTATAGSIRFFCKLEDWTQMPQF